jgi:acetyltransferase-like isoleucine patch superfamily enzyme
VINDDVWIGASAIILSGAQIGKGSIIAAGAVVSSIIPPFSIVVGNPGRVIANREKK